MLPRRLAIYVTSCLLLASFFITSPAAALKPNDPDYFLQWYIDKLGLPQAWDYTTGSREVTVAILDTGIAISHPDLAGNIWVNTDEIGGDGIDNDRNGYVDDVNGYDFYDNDPDPTPDLSGQYSAEAVTHGTVIAGIVGGVGNNLRGITGVAWNVRLMPLRVLDSNGQADLPPTLKAFEYAIANGADVINLSFVGEGTSDIFQSLIEEANRRGVVVVGAAGNGLSIGTDLDTVPMYPVCFGGTVNRALLIGVAASDKLDRISQFSNYGRNCVDVVAPGQDIYSTQINRGIGDPILNTDYSGGWQGTSLSAPIIAGTAALMKSLSKSLTPQLIWQFITETVDPIDTKRSPWLATKISTGRVNVGKAVKRAVEYLGPTGAGGVTMPLPPVSVEDAVKQGIVIAAGNGLAPEVRIFDTRDKQHHRWLAYQEKFRGGVNVAAGDVNRDGVTEIITAAGPGGGPHLRVLDQSGALLAQFFAYDKDFRGGVMVAVGDVTGDGVADIVTAPQSGLAPIVRVFDLSGKKVAEFTAYDSRFRGGVNLAVGDVNLDGVADIVTAPRIGGGPHIRLWTGSGKLLGQFMAYDAKFRGGVSVAVGQTLADPQPEIITVPMTAASAEVKMFDQYGQVKKAFVANGVKKPLGPLQIAVGDMNLDGADEIGISRLQDSAVVLFDAQGFNQATWQAVATEYSRGISFAFID